jgi:hypothetical protein
MATTAKMARSVPEPASVLINSSRERLRGVDVFMMDF